MGPTSRRSQQKLARCPLAPFSDSSHQSNHDRDYGPNLCFWHLPGIGQSFSPDPIAKGKYWPFCDGHWICYGLSSSAMG